MAILRNASYNFLGQLIPAGVAILCMPALVGNLGAERVGLLTIIWVIVGYFSILDFGLGFAVTKSVSEALAQRREDRIPALFWGAVAVQVVLALIGAGLFLLAVPSIVQHRLKISGELIAESQMAFTYCAIAIPFLLSSSSITGLLHAAQRFDLAVKIQLPLSAAQYLLPLLVSLFSKNLGWIVAILLLNRIVGTAVTLWTAARIFPEIGKRVSFDFSLLLGQLRFGTWITVANVLSPIMVYLDRFLIGAMLSVTLVAYYAVPMDAVMKFSAIPNSLSTVLFSVFSFYSVAEGDHTVELLRKSFRGLLLVLLLPISLSIVFSGDLLHLWLGAEFESRSGLVLQILLVGIWANSLTRIPFVFISSSGRPDIITKVMIVQTPVQLVFSYALIKAYGLQGAAVAWSSRLMVELVLYLAIAGRLSGRPILSPVARESLKPLTGMGAILGFGVLAGALSPGLRVLAALGLLLGGILFIVKWCLQDAERIQLKRALGM